MMDTRVDVLSMVYDTTVYIISSIIDDGKAVCLLGEQNRIEQQNSTALHLATEWIFWWRTVT